MSLDKFVTRGFTASTGGGTDSWVSKSGPTSGASSTTSSHSTGTSFVMGGVPGSRAGSSRASEAYSDRSSGRNSHSSLSHGSSSGSSSRGSESERRSFSEDLIVSVFPQCDPRTVLAVLVVLGISAAGYLIMQLGGIAKDPDDGYGRSVQSEILERRGRLR